MSDHDDLLKRMAETKTPERQVSGEGHIAVFFSTEIQRIIEEHAKLKEDNEALRKTCALSAKAMSDNLVQIEALTKERDGWKEEAKRYANNAEYWRGKAEQRNCKVLHQGHIDGYVGNDGIPRVTGVSIDVDDARDFYPVQFGHISCADFIKGATSFVCKPSANHDPDNPPAQLDGLKLWHVFKAGDKVPDLTGMGLRFSTYVPSVRRWTLGTGTAVGGWAAVENVAYYHKPR